MTIDRFVNLLATVTLFEMMVTIGLGVTLAENPWAWCETGASWVAPVRNVGVTLVIAVAGFPGIPAVTAATAFGLFQTILVALIALAWARLTRNAKKAV